MTRMHSSLCLRRIAVLSLLAAFATAGCGEDTKSGTQVAPAPEQAQATNNMADFMKTGGPKAAPKAAPAK